MTTTQLHQGLNDGERSSSRVLQPPGGGSSNIFGNAQPDEVKVKDYYHSDIFHQEDQKQSMGTPNAKKPTGAAAAPFACDAAPPPEVKPNKPVTLVSSPIVPPPPERTGGKPVKRAVNPILGECVPEPASQASTRVRQPPGGASSGLW